MEEKVIIIGAGKSGRGMLGEMFYLDNQYKIIFADVDRELTDGLKAQGFYNVKKTNLATKNSQITRVDGFEVINVTCDHDKYIESLSEVKLICTALKEKDFESVIDSLVEMIQLRIKKEKKEIVYITLGANFVGMHEYCIKRFETKLNEQEKYYFDNYVRLVMSIVNRKNLLPINKEDMLDKYTIVGDDKSVLRVERKEIEDLNPMPSFFLLEDDLSKAMAIKIWGGNVIQCSMALPAISKGYTDTYQAVMDDECAMLAYNSAKEALYGVYNEYNIDGDVDAAARKGVDIFKNDKFCDSLARIVSEPIRKISYNDRFIGPAKLAIKYGIKPNYITRCMAYAFLPSQNTDYQFEILRKDIAEKGIEHTVKEYTGLSFDNENEKKIAELIINNYYDICQNT